MAYYPIDSSISYLFIQICIKKSIQSQNHSLKDYYDKYAELIFSNDESESVLVADYLANVNVIETFQKLFS